jgi:hypothetical protein
MDDGATFSRKARARRPGWAALVPLLAVALATDAAWLSGHDLKRHCDAFVADSTSREAAACIAFVQGFIATPEARDGARDATIGSDSTEFSERAERARGAARLQAMLAERNRYCIGDGVDLDEIVGRVSAHLAALAAQEPGGAALSDRAERVVQRALVASFPCSGG